MLCRILLISLPCITVFVRSVHGASAGESTVTAVATALNRRNIHMKDVAGYKYAKNKPVEDLPRERDVMKVTVANASTVGLNANSVKPFIHAQMDVAKDIQRAFIAGWKAQPEPNWQPRNLDDVRKDILEEDAKILELVHEQLKHGGFKESHRPEIYSHLTAPHMTEAYRKLLVDTMFKVKLKTTQ